MKIPAAWPTLPERVALRESVVALSMDHLKWVQSMMRRAGLKTKYSYQQNGTWLVKIAGELKQ